MDNDLIDNPMVKAARNSMTPEQEEKYKKIGEYMYNSIDYKMKEIGSRVKQMNQNDLVIYAESSLRSGLDPMDLTEEEVKALIEKYGEKWYVVFEYKEEEVPKPIIHLVTDSEIEETCCESKISPRSNALLCRQQRRMLARKQAKKTG